MMLSKSILVLGGTLFAAQPTLAAGPPPMDRSEPGPHVVGSAAGVSSPVQNKRRRSKPKRRRGRRYFRLVQLQSGPGFQVRSPHRAYGTPLALARLQEVLIAGRLHFLGFAPFVVQDLSRRGGGKLHPHLSHRDGRDVDIRLPHRKGARKWGKATRRNLDLPRAWFLINSLIQTGDLEFIFLDRKLERLLYRHALKQGASVRRLRETFRWIIRHEPGHEAHVHVRFRKGRLGDGRQSKIWKLVLQRSSAPILAKR
jgi:hypothetical protein